MTVTQPGTVRPNVGHAHDREERRGKPVVAVRLIIPNPGGGDATNSRDYPRCPVDKDPQRRAGSVRSCGSQLDAASQRFTYHGPLCLTARRLSISTGK